jgi:hypothetical protein
LGFRREKHSGLIEIRHTKATGIGTKIKFYKEEEEKGENLSKKDMASFVIGSDSFALVNDFMATPLVKYKTDFAKVLDTGAINLYVHIRKARQSGNSGAAYYAIYLEEYLIRKNASNDYFCIRGKKTLRDIFLPMIENCPELHNSVSSMKPKDAIEQLPALVKEYNEYKKTNP